MTSQHDFDEARPIVEDYWVTDQENRDLLMDELVEFELYEYPAWCRVRGLDPADPKVDHDYKLLHMVYAGLWGYLGADVFFAHLEAARRRRRKK